MPEVTKRSPFWMSADTGMKGTSMEPSLPEPTAMARRPFRVSITGTDWSFSVRSVTSLVKVPTAVTCPTTPSPSMTGMPALMPCVRPLSSTSFLAKGLRP